MFSRKTDWDLQPSRLSEALAERRDGGLPIAAGLPIFDLTVSNPTAAGFDLDVSAVAQALAAGCTLAYQPQANGLLAARQAVCDYYAEDHGIALDPANLILTVSTSEAYSFLFRLLCDAGDEALACRPSYPLFDYLADLDDVALRSVEWLQDEDGWHLDTHALAQAAGERTRAVLLVHPNNPTGHFVSSRDREWLDSFCAERGLALIVDEVFLDYPLEGGQLAAASFLARPARALTFVLSGVSKICALPQMKLAWIAVHGPAALRDAALARLEVIADTFLSLNTPMQAAAASLLDVRRQIQPQILARLHGNLATLEQALAAQTRRGVLTRARVEGGWYATLQIPNLSSSEASAIDLLRQTGVYVHPGDFFGFHGGSQWILSLLTPTEEFTAGVALLCDFAKTLR